MSEPKLKEIAARIDAHLRRFEADPKINVAHRWVSDGVERTGLRPYYNARASVAGRFVAVQYISFQVDRCLTKADALAYLARLDAGFVGTHFEKAKP